MSASKVLRVLNSGREYTLSDLVTLTGLAQHEVIRALADLRSSNLLVTATVHKVQVYRSPRRASA
jgi:DNA-binding IclR family transcriptional regulator